MARDRTAGLIRQAAAERWVDFSAARPSDRLWWRWLHGRLDALEQRNLREFYRLKHAQNVSAMQIVDAEGVKTHWGRANDALSGTYDSLFPWYAKDETAEDKKSHADHLRDLWVDAWGDPDDPLTQAKIDATARALAG